MADNNPVAMMLETPLAGLIEQLGLAIANAQFSLDRNAIAIARMLADPEGGIQLPGDDRVWVLRVGDEVTPLSGGAAPVSIEAWDGETGATHPLPWEPQRCANSTSTAPATCAGCSAPTRTCKPRPT